jgi:hypothetical protein
MSGWESILRRDPSHFWAKSECGGDARPVPQSRCSTEGTIKSGDCIGGSDRISEFPSFISSFITGGDYSDRGKTFFSGQALSFEGS